ncbi:MAG TPA: hypothetical protein PKM73_21650 [Verrucomicrobiota bacterium]|nr:hypothetical protein [Verrucomicrobiota bacterium]HNU51505.1 hypothetical protein [Verrucomicrobiota bacterium]
MSGGTVRFTQVEIVKALGLGRGQGFRVPDLSAAVNVVYGPNGSGKSTLARVMQKLLWPMAREVEPALAHAAVMAQIEVAETHKTRRWTVEIESGAVTSTVDGVSTPVPAGRPDLHARYRMPLSELLVEDNADFAREILRQASGGFDLAPVAALAGFAERPVNPRALQSALREAATGVAEARSSQESLKGRRDELVSQGARLEEVREKLRSLGELARAKEYLVACADRDHVQGQHDAFEAQVKALSGSEQEELARLEKDVRAAEAAFDRGKRERVDLAGQIDRLRATEVERQADLDSLQAAVAALEVAEGRAQTEMNRATESAAERAAAEAHLFNRRQAGEAAAIDRAALAAADDLLKLALACRASEVAHEAEAARIRLLPEPDAALPDALVLRRGIEALASWLRAPSPASPPVGDAARIPLGKLGMVCAVLGVASLSGAVLVHWAFAAGAFGALAMFAAILLLSARKTEPAAVATTNAAAVYQDAFARLSLTPPADWSVASVSAALDGLVEQLERRTAIDAARPVRAAHEKHRAELEQARKRLGDACADLEARYGIAAGDADPIWIRLLIEAVLVWQKAVQKDEGAAAASAAARASLDAARQECKTRFASAGVDLGATACVTADLATRRFESLREKRRLWLDLDERYRQCEGRMAEAGRTCDEARNGLAEFWRRLGFAAADRQGLARLLARRRDFVAVDDALRIARQRAADAENRLGSAASLLPRGLVAIDSELGSEEALRLEENRLTREIAEVEADLRHASKGHELSERLEKLAEANARLRRQEELNAEQAVGYALTGWLREQAREVLAPRVLTRAQDLLTRITNGRLVFQAEESASEPRFVAANADEPWRPVTQLSSGERVQLLMAVRLAFLEENEERALPLLLDEVLASSDDERSGHIIQTVLEIARSGRQVFYFTAQADERARWISALAAAGIESRVFDLGALRGMTERAAHPLRPAPDPRAPVPAPGGLTHRQYGELLGVPGVDVWDLELDRLHLWHVIEDPELLHRVLCSGIERFGPLRRLIRHSGYDGLGESRETVLATGLAFQAAFRAWRLGRGRPVTPEVLRQAAGVTDVFRQRVVELAASVNGDAEQLLEKLGDGTLRNWREKSTEELRESLVREGCLDESRRLGRDEIREAVQAELMRSGSASRIAAATLDRVVESLPWSITLSSERADSAGNCPTA